MYLELIKWKPKDFELSDMSDGAFSLILHGGAGFQIAWGSDFKYFRISVAPKNCYELCLNLKKTVANDEDWLKDKIIFRIGGKK